MTAGTLSQRKRAAILEAAVAEFQDRGFQATSMDRIAARAQVSKRTVYNHFDGKDALFRAIVDQLWDRFRKVTDHSYDRSAALADQLRGIGAREVELLVSRKFVKLARVTLAEYIRSPELAREAFDNMQECESGLTGWVRSAVADKRLRVQDPAVAARQFTSLLKAFVFWPQMLTGRRAPDRAERTAVIESAVAMFLDHYATRKERRK